MSAVTRKYEIAKRRRRRNKIRKLRLKIAKAKDGAVVQKLVAKILRIHPHYPIQQNSK